MERIEKLKAYLEAQPDDSFLKHALALEYIKLGKDTDAQQLFESVLTKDPGYVGTYYHLAKLLERSGNLDNAILVYEKGIIAAKTAGDNHAKSELQMALDDLVE